MCDYCTWIDTILAKAKEEADIVEEKRRNTPAKKNPVIIVHGGAGRIPNKELSYMLQEVKKAALKSYRQLLECCSSIDAVETAICHMESQPYFNCARGGSLDINGNIVMDAGLMDNNWNAGCIGSVRDIEHPISLAKKVLQETDNILVVDNGAQRFAIEMGFSILKPGSLKKNIISGSSTQLNEDNEETISNSTINDQDELQENIEDTSSNFENHILEVTDKPEVTPAKKLPQCVARFLMKQEAKQRELEKSKLEADARRLLNAPTVLQVGGVGAVALDRNGILVSGTSTAGHTGKISGYLSPSGTVIGCGIFAEGNACASVSGNEKSIYLYGPARKIVERINTDINEVCGAATESAVETELNLFEKEMFESDIGGVAVDINGTPMVYSKSMHFPFAFCDNGMIFYGYENDSISYDEIRDLEGNLDCLCEDID